MTYNSNRAGKVLDTGKIMVISPPGDDVRSGRYVDNGKRTVTSVSSGSASMVIKDVNGRLKVVSNK